MKWAGRSPLRKGDVYAPTSASVWTVLIGPAPLVPDALADPTAVLFWPNVFGPKNWGPQPVG